jgi:hypothetical protein
MPAARQVFFFEKKPKHFCECCRGLGGESATARKKFLPLFSKRSAFF